MKIIVTMMLTLCLALPFAFAEIDSETVVAYWLFDEGEGDIAHDSSGNGHDGVIDGAKWTTGIFGSALQYDGSDDFVEVPHDDDLSLEIYTIAAWVKLQATGSWQAIVHKQGDGGTSERNYVMNVVDTTGVVAHEFASGGANQRLDGTTVVTDDMWHHIAISYDGTTSRVFVDGKLEAEAVMPAPDLNSAPVRFGRAGGSGGARAKGIIDEIIIFNAAYGESEMDEIMAGLSTVMSVEPEGKLPLTWSELKR